MKHSWRFGRAFSFPQLLAGLFLGVDIVQSAETPDLVKGYGYFRDEALASSKLSARNGQYRWLGPHQSAWKTLFPGDSSCVFCIAWIFSNAVASTKIRKLTVSGMSTKPRVNSILPNAYGLREWAQKTVKQPSILKRLLNLKGKSQQFQVAYDYPEGARTSYARPADELSRSAIVCTMQYFHGSEAAARLYLRAVVLLWNFHPLASGQQQRLQSAAI